jgi:hypothetical protein
MNDAVYYHEDSYRQIELIPEKNYFKTLNDIDNLPLVPNDQYGYAISIQRDEHLIKTESLKIPLLEINDLLSPLSLNFFQEVKTGYSNQYKIKRNTIAFGFERVGIFIESDEGIVVNIWLCLSPEFKQSKTSDNLLNALHLIGDKYGLVLIDWDEESVIRLSFIQSVKNHLQEVFGF